MSERLGGVSRALTSLIDPTEPLRRELLGRYVRPLSRGSAAVELCLPEAGPVARWTDRPSDDKSTEADTMVAVRN
jgi:hypothetical protein